MFVLPFHSPNVQQSSDRLNSSWVPLLSRVDTIDCALFPSKERRNGTSGCSGGALSSSEGTFRRLSEFRRELPTAIRIDKCVPPKRGLGRASEGEGASVRVGLYSYDQDPRRRSWAFEES